MSKPAGLCRLLGESLLQTLAIMIVNYPIECMLLGLLLLLEDEWLVHEAERQDGKEAACAAKARVSCLRQMGRVLCGAAGVAAPAAAAHAPLALASAALRGHGVRRATKDEKLRNLVRDREVQAILR